MWYDSKAKQSYGDIETIILLKTVSSNGYAIQSMILSPDSPVTTLTVFPRGDILVDSIAIERVRVPLLISQVAGCVFTIELHRGLNVTKRLITDARNDGSLWKAVVQAPQHYNSKCHKAALAFNYISLHDVTCSRSNQ